MSETLLMVCHCIVSLFTGVSILLFCAGCDISAGIKKDYRTSDDPIYLDLQNQKKATRILIISYVLLALGALTFIVVFSTLRQGLWPGVTV